MKKRILLAFLGLCFTNAFGQKQTDFQLSSHILDVSLGKPASNVAVELEEYDEATQKWIFLDKKQTDNNGRVPNFLPYKKEAVNQLKKYKLVFFTEDYYKSKNIESFYPSIEVIFQIKDNEHYHVPITLSPFGYSTYRGS